MIYKYIVPDYRTRLVATFLAVLTSCMERQNLLLLKFCQNIYPIEFIVKISDLRGFDTSFMIAFLRFMYQLYVKNCHKDKLAVNFILGEFIDDNLLESLTEAATYFKKKNDPKRQSTSAIFVVTEDGVISSDELNERFIESIMLIVLHLLNSQELIDLAVKHFNERFLSLCQRLATICEDCLFDLPMIPQAMFSKALVRIGENRQIPSYVLDRQASMVNSIRVKNRHTSIQIGRAIP